MDQGRQTDRGRRKKPFGMYVCMYVCMCLRWLACQAYRPRGSWRWFAMSGRDVHRRHPEVRRDSAAALLVEPVDASLATRGRSPALARHCLCFFRLKNKRYSMCVCVFVHVYRQLPSSEHCWCKILNIHFFLLNQHLDHVIIQYFDLDWNTNIW